MEEVIVSNIRKIAVSAAGSTYNLDLALRRTENRRFIRRMDSPYRNV